MKSCLRPYWRMSLVAFPLLLAGCATLQHPKSKPPIEPATPLIKQAEALRLIFSGNGQATSTASLELPPKTDRGTTLTLDQIQVIARERNPTFQEFEAHREAARAEVLQALAYPNPEISLGLGVDTAREAPKNSVLSYGLDLVQPIELPAKRRSRRAAAEATGPIVEREADVFRAALRADVMKAYYTVLFHEHAVRLGQDALHIEQEIDQIVERRIKAGEAPEIDRVKAQVEVLKASRAVQVEQRNLASARAVLSALCGRALPLGFTLADSLENPLAGANAAEARRIALAQHPTLRRLEAILKQKELIIQRENKAWYPDLKPGLNLGQGIDARTLGAGLGLELPFWNRNKAGIAAALAELHKIQAELARARQETQRDIEIGTQTYESAREQLAAFSAGLRAAAAESLRIGTFLYQEGESDFLQLLDARRTARQTETEYLQALVDANIARAELERAIGIGGNLE